MRAVFKPHPRSLFFVRRGKKSNAKPEGRIAIRPYTPQRGLGGYPIGKECLTPSVNQHRVAVGEEAIALGNGFVIGG